MLSVYTKENNSSKKEFYLYPALFVALFFLLWELSIRYTSTTQFLLPSPIEVGKNLWQNSARFHFHASVTLEEMMLGVFFAFIAAFPLAWLMFRYPTAKSTLQPLFIFIQCTPMFTLAPLMVLIFGWTKTAIIVPTALTIFFPLTLNIYHGLKTVPESLLNLFRIQNASEWQTLVYLRIPWALPQIFAGLKISASIAGIGAVAGEWAGAQSGLGLLMGDSHKSMDFETSFGALFCLASISISFYAFICSLEYFFSPFRRKTAFKTVFSLFPLLILTILLNACEASSDKTSTRLLLDWYPTPNHVPLYAGIQKGFFSQEGIQLEIQKLKNPADTIPFLESRQCDIALYYMPYTLLAHHKGAKNKIIGVLFKEPLEALCYRKDLQIHDLESLNGKNIACSLGKFNSAYLKQITGMHSSSAQVHKKVNFDMTAALSTGQVDACFGLCWNIEVPQLHSLGVDIGFFKLSELKIPNFYELLAICSEGYLKENPGFSERFQRALQNSIDFSQKYPEEAFNLYASMNPDKFKKTLDWERKSWEITYPLLAKKQIIEDSCLNVFSQWMRNNDIINQDINVTELLP